MIKSILLATVMILVISFMLPGCYTQLSRPRVDIEDEYYEESQNEEVEEYYQDEGALVDEDSRDVYIYNYYPSYWTDYYDYWYYSPYQWRYIGPYPYHWWDPYGHWWAPSWYVGYSYYDYWWGGYPRYYNSYNRYGYYYNGSKRTYGKRPFTRRSVRTVEREKRIDSESSLSKPIGPTRVERPGHPSTTLATPMKDKSLSPDRKQRSVKEMVNNRLKSKPRAPKKMVDDGLSRTLTKKRPVVSKSPGTKTIKSPPRSSKSYKKPNIIKRAPSKYKPGTSKKSYSSSRRSNQNYSSGSRSSGTRISKPSTQSSTSRSSGTSSSSSRSSSSRSSGSKSSGSSKSSGKSGKR